MPRFVAFMPCDPRLHTADELTLTVDGCDASVPGRVLHVIAATGFLPVSCIDWPGLRQCAAVAHAAVVVALDLPRVAPSWPEDDSLPCPLILVTTDDRETVRHLAGIRTSCAVFTDEVERRLARQLLRMALSDGRMILRESIRGRKMHVALMRTLLALVDMPLLEIRPSRRHTRRFPRTVGDLAERAGVSADYLRHLAVDARLPLGTILHRYAAIRAAESIAICTPQDVIAELFGYEDASGVRKLIRRNLGVGVRDLARLGIQSHYADLARLVGTHKTRDSHGTDR